MYTFFYLDLHISPVSRKGKQGREVRVNPSDGDMGTGLGRGVGMEGGGGGGRDGWGLSCSDF
jgi:hypothetical protein